MTTELRTCPSCKKANAGDFAFCINCGAPLSAVAPTNGEPATPPPESASPPPAEPASSRPPELLPTPALEPVPPQLPESVPPLAPEAKSTPSPVPALPQPPEPISSPEVPPPPPVPTIARRPEPPHDLELHRAHVRALYVDVLSRGKLTVLDQICARDFAYHRPGIPDGLHDVDEFKLVVDAYRSAFPDITFAVDDMVAEGDRLAVRYTARGSNWGPLMGVPATDREVTFTGTAFCRFAGGRLTEMREEYDALGLLLQLGHSVAPPQPERPSATTPRPIWRRGRS